MSEVTISPDTQMQEIESSLPGARRALFQKYHVGGCSSCGFQPTDTLKQVCENHNLLDVEEVISWLHENHVLDKKMQISPEEVRNAMNNGSALKLLDFRPAEDRQFASVEGAIAMDPEKAQEIMDTWDKDSPLVMMCHHGISSMDAAAYFIGHGFTNVKSMTGGIDGWAQTVDTNIPRY